MRDDQFRYLPADDNPPPETLAEAAERYIVAHPTVRSPKTMNGYRQEAGRFDKHLRRPATVGDLTDESAVRFWKWRAKSVGANTVNGEAATLLALWRWCALNGWCKPPTVQPPQRVVKTPQALTVEQLHALWLAASRSGIDVGGVPGSVYWPCLLSVVWETAERIGAVLDLEWSSIDLAERWIHYPASTRKGGRADLLRPITTETAERIAKLKRHGAPTPFGLMKRGLFYLHWSALREAAGLPRWATPHSIRRSHASHLKANGGDATAALGHAAPYITEAHYIDPKVAASRGNLVLLPSLKPEGDKPGAVSKVLGLLLGKGAGND